MKFLWSGGGLSPFYGILTAPHHRGVPIEIKNGKPWGADLGCLEGPAYVKRGNLGKSLEWLKTVMGLYAIQCLFIAGFDIVANAKQTLEAYFEYKNYFEGWPFAYVAQDGSENYPIPDDCQTVFVGGSTAWKESTEAASVIARAVEAGKHVHIGRVNTMRRYKLFRALSGSENFTCDGTRQIYDGREKTFRAWLDCEKLTKASRQLALPHSYDWDTDLSGEKE